MSDGPRDNFGEVKVSVLWLMRSLADEMMSRLICLFVVLGGLWLACAAGDCMDLAFIADGSVTCMYTCGLRIEDFPIAQPAYGYL